MNRKGMEGLVATREFEEEEAEEYLDGSPAEGVTGGSTMTVGLCLGLVWLHGLGAVCNSDGCRRVRIMLAWESGARTVALNSQGAIARISQRLRKGYKSYHGANHEA